MFSFEISPQAEMAVFFFTLCSGNDNPHQPRQAKQESHLHQEGASWVSYDQLYTPFKKVTQHDFNWLYQFVYGFVFIMLGIIWKLGYLSSIDTSFVMIALQKRAQGD